MADNRVLTDTSVIIDFLRKADKQNSALWNIREKNECFMSSVTLFELQCGAKTEKHFEDIVKLRRWIDTVSFDDEVAEISSKIYQSLKRDNMMIEFRDIFIAATAVAMNLRIATLNRKHFERISDIVLLEI
ncbi:type II toxin-antitoxin system VapC family toxin [Candidatus Electrothrix sp.]|uniref:type II toxin-antitoxin system VapC family toxin n=1 Tax=Candidatus Electrothrix sp. TaxID=2170559 RepID=UPI004055E930